MFSKVKWRRWKRFSGPLIYGSKAMSVPKNTNHMDRVALLTSLVESGGRLGTVMSYDGTGMTAGLIQCIAVLPKALDSFSASNSPGRGQGSLWPLVERINNKYPEVTARLNEEFNDILRWEIKGGKVVHLGSTNPVNARDLRNELSPIHGVVPKHGEHWDSAKGWALIFHEIFSDPRTFNLQVNEARRHFIHFRTRAWGPLHRETVNSLVYERIPCDFHEDDPLDLAMALFFSFSVNAPRPALQILWKVFKHTVPDGKIHHQEERWRLAHNLISEFSKSTYGNWERRYQRTKDAARDIWPSHHFGGADAIMF